MLVTSRCVSKVIQVNFCPTVDMKFIRKFEAYAVHGNVKNLSKRKMKNK